MAAVAIVSLLKKAWWRFRPDRRDDASVSASRHIAPNLWKQRGNRTLAAFLASIPVPIEEPVGPIKLAHVINPFEGAEGSEGLAIQRAALDSIARARAFASPRIGVDLIAVGRENERLPDVPDALWGRPLARTSLDIGTFATPRPLPVLFDILDSAVEAAPEAEYIVFTNMDINVVTHFYDAVAALLSAGIDAMTINRWDVDKAYLQEASAASWPLAAAERPPRLHSGFDCFVFRRDAYPSFRRSLAIVGMPLVMRSLLYNMIATSKRMVMLTNVNLTYHFGSDQAWKNPTYADYWDHNRRETRALVDALRADRKAWRNLGPFLEAHEPGMDSP